MIYKCLGAVFVIAGCGGVGFSMASAHRKEEKSLRQLISALDYMECELQYRLTPLPDLCFQAAKECTGFVGKVFLNLARELENQITPDVSSCMNAAMYPVKEISRHTAEHLKMLGQSLGRFDLEGQLKGLEAVRNSARKKLEDISKDRDIRLRSYQTLGLCAGAALVILFI